MPRTTPEEEDPTAGGHAADRSSREPPHRRSLWRALVTWLAAPVSFLSAFFVACGPEPTPPDVLANQVRAAIHADVRVAPYEVDVDVDEKGRVILLGEVDRPDVKQIAEDRAREVEGVHTLLNRIEVRPRSESKG